MPKSDWSPELYLKFNKERIQPSMDLVSRTDLENPETIIDIGCGPGNSARVLAGRWPKANITGIDNSPAMIAKAKDDYPQGDWLRLDAGKEEIPGKFDLVFSNAAIQWIPDHAALLKKFYEALKEGGALAVQVPLFFEMPLGISISRISKDDRWAAQTSMVDDLFTIHTRFEYYDLLCELFDDIEMWVTDYLHVMDSHLAILEMVRSTGLRPYLDKLESDGDKKEYANMVLEDIKNDYSGQKNGKVLFPFTRLFFIGRK